MQRLVHKPMLYIRLDRPVAGEENGGSKSATDGKSRPPKRQGVTQG
jgi:hypothetical protein